MMQRLILIAILVAAIATLTGCGGGGGGGGGGNNTTTYSIQGTISLGGATPSGVTVDLYSGGVRIAQMTTLADGKYRFEAPIGTYEVRAAKTGYSSEERTVTVNNPSITTIVNITLSAVTPDLFSVTGTVMVEGTSTPIVGAIVEIGSYQTATQSNGTFRIDMTSTPIMRTFSVNGRNATPAPGYFDFWCRADGKIQNAKCIELPIIPKGTTSVGTIYLMSEDYPPPFPPSCP